VAKALRQTLPEFLMGPAKSDSLTKFIAERQDMQNMPIFRLASVLSGSARVILQNSAAI
jgi:hypothetical protein